ncbi:MAG: hypothetical protein ACI9G1_002566 [Pirellulaceae bacterium]
MCSRFDLGEQNVGMQRPCEMLIIAYVENNGQHVSTCGILNKFNSDAVIYRAKSEAALADPK